MLTEWHLTPEYINTRWTDEILAAMVQARGDRMGLLNSPITNGTPKMDSYEAAKRGITRRVSDVDLFKSMGVVVKKR